MDRAVAAPTMAIEPPRPYTIATARQAGWTWRIPLQHRTGNGHVYASRYMDTDTATRVLLQAVDGDLLADPRHLRFVTGKRKVFWKANCVAIGLSAGFLEPLESTSIHLIQSGVAKLLALFPDKSFSPTERDEYNRLLSVSYQHIRDFIILHYAATYRDDTPFWKDMRGLDLPETLKHKMALMESSGRFFRYDDELFSVVSWLAVLHGQGVVPEAWDPIADRFEIETMKQRLESYADLIAGAANAMPDHDTFIREECLTAAMAH